MEHYTIATVAEQNPDFRRVLWTGKHTQLVIMTVPPGGELPPSPALEIGPLKFVSYTAAGVLTPAQRASAGRAMFDLASEMARIAPLTPPRGSC